MCEFYTYIDPDLLNRIQATLRKAEGKHRISSKGLFPQVKLDGLDVSHMLTYIFMLKKTMDQKMKEETAPYKTGKEYILKGFSLIFSNLYKTIFPNKAGRRQAAPTGPFI